MKTKKELKDQLKYLHAEYRECLDCLDGFEKDSITYRMTERDRRKLMNDISLLEWVLGVSDEYSRCAPQFEMQRRINRGQDVTTPN